jgi:hypothetical protein
MGNPETLTLPHAEPVEARGRGTKTPTSAFPAKAGTQTLTHWWDSIIWIPAFAGKSVERELIKTPKYPRHCERSEATQWTDTYLN